MTVQKGKTITQGGGQPYFLWTNVVHNFDVVGIGAFNTEFLYHVMAACYADTKEASYNYGLTPKFAELLSSIYADDLAFQSAVKAGRDMGDRQRPLERALNRLNFRTGILFKPEDEKSVRQTLNRAYRPLETKPAGEGRRLSDNDRDAQAGYLCFLRQLVKQSLYYIHYFARILTGLTPTLISSINAYNDFAIMRVMNKGLFFKPRVSVEDLTTLLTSDDLDVVTAARMRCIMALISDIPEEPQSMSARIQLETASAPSFNKSVDDMDGHELVRRPSGESEGEGRPGGKNRKTFFCMSALGTIYDAPQLEETYETANKLERYQEPFLVHYLFMIYNHVPHARAKPFFEDLTKDAGGKCTTVNKHLMASGINTKQGPDTGRINSKMGNTLATLYLTIYRNGTRSQARRPMFLVTVYQFFRFQVCPDLPKEICRYADREFSITCAARLMDDIATGKTLVREEHCVKCGQKFSFFGLNSPHCPVCMLTGESGHA